MYGCKYATNNQQFTATYPGQEFFPDLFRTFSKIPDISMTAVNSRTFPRFPDKWSPCPCHILSFLCKTFTQNFSSPASTKRRHFLSQQKSAAVYRIVTFARGDWDSRLCIRRFSAAGDTGAFIAGPGFLSVAASSASTTEVPLDALFSPESCGVLGKLDIMLESGWLRNSRCCGTCLVPVTDSYISRY